MSIYKINVSKDGINFEWVVINGGRVIWNPTEEDLKNAVPKSYSKTNICHICRIKNEITDNSKLYPTNVTEGEITREHVCKHHQRESIGLYKIRVSLDDQNFSWMIYDSRNKKLIIDADEIYLKLARIKHYNHANVCFVCNEEWKKGEITDLPEDSILHPGNAREYDSNWYCERHGNRYRLAHDPNSSTNIKKSISHRRTGNLHAEHIILGDNGEELTKRMCGVKRLSEEYDNFELPLDHSHITTHISIMIGDKLVDLYGKIPQTKTSRIIWTGEGWSFRFIEEWFKEFDIEILWCISSDGSSVERGYIYKKKDMCNIKGITIIKNPCRGGKEHDRRRITDDDFMKRADKEWKNIIKGKLK